MSLGVLFTHLTHSFSDWFFPARCEICGSFEECAEHRLPSGGEQANRPGQVRCLRCASLLPRGVQASNACAVCQKAGFGLQRLIALGSYGADSPIKPWVLAFKHGGRRDLAAPLGAALGACLRVAQTERDPTTLIVPVPLHPLRRWERGYDQALLLGQQVARMTGQVCVPALFRSRATAPQGSLLSRPRSTNVAQVFAVHPEERARLRGRRVWLVDDIYTSGATLRSCAQALRSAGATKVGALVLGRVEARGTWVR